VLVSGDGQWYAETLLYLAAAGVGRIGIYGTEQLPLWAALAPDPQPSAAIALQRLNPDCSIVVHDRQDHESVVRLVQQYDLVIAEPNVQLHAACYATQRPFLCGQVSATTAWLAVYRGYEKHSPCLSCVPVTLPEMAPPFDIAELAGPFVGTVLATEAIKLLLGLTPVGPTKLLQYTFPDLLFNTCVLAKNPKCPVCRHSE
jgi:molybdopterin/thiamine biosynthesis adenylyltransferase